jgi:RNA polymerase primary sigma factor
MEETQGRIENIKKYILHAGRGGLEEKALRKALTSANLPKVGLFELASNAKGSVDDLARKFSQAMSRYIEARERMTVCNLRLVLHIAQRFRAKGLPFDDLVQEGNLGLLKAVERFDWRRGFRFSTYATWWIRQQLSRALANDGKTIRTPVHVNETILRITREANVMEGKEGKRVTAEALAERLSISSEKISTLLLCVNEPLPIHELGQGGVPPAEFVEDCFSPDPFEIVARDNARKIILDVVADLNPRTAQVLNLRFGLANDDALTLEEVGAQFDLTRERIRQIEVKGLGALRAPCRTIILRDLLDEKCKRRATSEDACLGEADHDEKDMEDQPNMEYVE